jgi:UDPglucose--hexose-1-phosphate uridylyltransferase
LLNPERSSPPASLHRASLHRASPQSASPQRRLDLFTGKHVLIAPEREHRPDEFRAAVRSSEQTLCPFCPGNEGQTPPEQLRFGGDDWLTRVFSNKFPAVCESGASAPPSNAAGAHEVIVESPRHVARYSELTPEEVCSAFRVYAARLRHYQSSGFASGFLFKNCGRDAGASLEHVHSQLIALHRVPTSVRHRIQRNRRYFARWSRYISEMVLEREQRDNLRVVFSDSCMLAFAPFASRAPYELRIVPLAAEPSLELLSDPELERIALLVRRLVIALESVLPDVSYNVIFHTKPWRMRGGDTGFDRWQIELVPRLSRWAGYELGTEEYINPVLPEHAAALIKTHLQ